MIRKGIRFRFISFHLCLSVLVTFLVLCVGRPLAGWADPDSPDLPDKDITIAIESRFLIDRNIPEKAINVQTEEGLVTLGGEVSTLLAKERAGDVVATIRGVKGIINSIHVKPVERISNEHLGLSVMGALAADPATDSYELTIQVDDGLVILSGKVDSWQEKQLSEQVVKSVKGVREIESRIIVQPDATRPDDEIEAEVVRRLQSDVWVHEKLIGIMVERGHVTLTGTVGSLAEKYSAFTDAWVSGVTGVNVDPLKVEWWARDRMLRNPGNVLTDDTRLEHAIRTALKYDPRIPNITEIGIRLLDGTVILSGIVENMAAKFAAERTALNIRGIWRVRNVIEVRSDTSIPDKELEHRVRETFNRHPFVEQYDIKVSSQDGIVALEGYLQSPHEMLQALRTASAVKGVTDVVNYLEFQSRKHGDENIWRKIRQSYWWDPRLYDRDISVIVRNGVATLEGEVGSLLEWRLARQLANEAGAKQVRNSLTVNDSPDILGLSSHGSLPTLLHVEGKDLRCISSIHPFCLFC